VGPWIFLGDNVPTVFAYGAFDLIANTNLEGKPRLVGGFQEFFSKGLRPQRSSSGYGTPSSDTSKINRLASNGQLPA
jgi:hypothetical protein